MRPAAAGETDAGGSAAAVSARFLRGSRRARGAHGRGYDEGGCARRRATSSIGVAVAVRLSPAARASSQPAAPFGLPCSLVVGCRTRKASAAGEAARSSARRLAWARASPGCRHGGPARCVPDEELTHCTAGLQQCCGEPWPRCVPVTRPVRQRHARLRRRRGACVRRVSYKALVLRSADRAARLQDRGLLKQNPTNHRAHSLSTQHAPPAA